MSSFNLESFFSQCNCGYFCLFDFALGGCVLFLLRLKSLTPLLSQTKSGTVWTATRDTGSLRHTQWGQSAKSLVILWSGLSFNLVQVMFMFSELGWIRLTVNFFSLVGLYEQDLPSPNSVFKNHSHLFPERYLVRSYSWVAFLDNMI